MKYEDFKVPIYGYRVRLVICEDVEEYLTSTKLYEGDGKCKAIVLDFEDIEEYDFDCMAIFSSTNVTGGLITHEAFHILCRVMVSRGFTLTDSSEECCAYLMEWLYKKLVTTLIKLKQEENGNTNTSEEV